MKSNTFKTVTLVFGTALFISTNSFAQSGNREDRKKPPKFSELLKEIDANEDGFISEEDLKKAPKPKRGGKRQ
jgi:Ca2+-binding EF-hand superfamily protein